MNKRMKFIMLAFLGFSLLSLRAMENEKKSNRFQLFSQDRLNSFMCPDDYRKLAQGHAYSTIKTCLTDLKIDRAQLLLSLVLQTNTWFSCNEKCELIQAVRLRMGNTENDARFNAIECLLMRGCASHLLTNDAFEAEMAKKRYEDSEEDSD